MLEWIERVRELSAAALTVRAQTIDPADMGDITWPLIMPRQNVDSVRVSDVLTLDTRYVADRREWQGRGRLIPLRTPAARELEMIPIESYYTIGEYEMQILRERTLNTQSTIERIIGAEMPARTDSLVRADFRRIEVDTYNAWLSGVVTVRNPQDASKTYQASYGIDSSRYQTAATAWNNGAVNAYDEFLAWYEDAIEASGPGQGAMLRLATLKAIQADAPNLANSVKMTRAELQSRIEDDLGQPFRFVINENTADIFNDGGIVTTRTKVFTAQRVAFIPAGGRVGYNAFAPVSRAMELSAQVPGAGIDIRGATVYHEQNGNGRELTVEAQVNAMPVPDEGLVYVINAGV